MLGHFFLDMVETTIYRQDNPIVFQIQRGAEMTESASSWKETRCIRDGSIVKDYLDGMLIREISVSYGVSAVTIYGILRRLGVPKNRKPGNGHKARDRQQEACVLNLRACALSYPHIGNLLGISKQRAYQIFKRAITETSSQ